MFLLRFFGFSSFSEIAVPRDVRTRSLPVLLLLVLCWSDAVLARAVEQPFGQGVLWKVEEPNSEAAPNYVFGTIHVTDRRVLNLPMEVRKAFAHARAAIFEIRQGGSDAAKMRNIMLLDEDQSLSDYLNDDQLRLVAKAAELYGFDERDLQRLKPWGVYLLLSAPPSEDARQKQGRKILDFAMQTRARDFGLPVYGLETLEEQMALFDAMSDRDQVAVLDSTLQQLEQAESLYENMLQLYLAGDISGIFAMITDSPGAPDAEALTSFLDNLLDRRNINMVDRMQSHLQEGGAFVAIGALHLPGELGVLNLLQSKGYTLTRVY